MHTKEYLLNNLLGDNPIDWEQACKDFKIGGFKPSTLKIVPRDDVMRSLVTVTEQASIERALMRMTLGDDASSEIVELKKLARQYVVLANKSARLPKFTKWVSSMFQSNSELMGVLSKAGQMGGKSDIVISCNPVDILRGSATPHFYSCLTDDGYYNDILPGVVTKCPGIAVAYVDGPDGLMKCRIWLNHGIVNGKDVIVVMSQYGNGFTTEQIAELIAQKGYDVYESSYWGNGGTPFQLINTFKEHGIHWDILEREQAGIKIASAKCEPAIKKIVKKRAA